MLVHTIETAGLAIKTYLIVDPETGKSAVIDATRDLGPLLVLIEKEACTVVAILETHVHADFVSGAKELKNRLNNGAQIYCSSLGGSEWIPSYCDVAVKDREKINFGHVVLQAWHTPGHTPEHLMWVAVEGKEATIAFTGDFLFPGSVGRPDLLGKLHSRKLAESLYHSVFAVLPELPGSLKIYPAHGAGSLCGKSIGQQPYSTLDIERKTNPYLQERSEEEWIQKVMQSIPAAPTYFAQMKRINIQGAPLLSSLTPAVRLGAQQVVDQLDHTQMVDVRSEEEFARAHVKGALNISVQGSFLSWIPIFIHAERNLELIAKDEIQQEKAVRAMRLIGIDCAMNYFLWNEEAEGVLSQLAGALESFPMITTGGLLERLQRDEGSFMLIDVRTPQEWNSGHIKEAKLIELPSLSKHIPNLPREQTIGLICGSGFRASIAASILQREGFTSVSNVQGGMSDWYGRGFPVVKEASK